MDHLRLASLNLNLLVTLDALLEERSVTRAAERLGVTQSAVSHALRQLREMLGDPLLVRVGGAMEPTPRGDALAAPVRRGLSTLSQTLSDDPRFDPLSSKRTIVLATTDYVAVLLLPALLAALREQAPGVDVEVVSSQQQTELARHVSGEIDLSLMPSFNSLGPLKRRKLFDERFACIVRNDHPVINKRLSLKQYVELGHALITPRGVGPSVVDRLLAERGLSRRVALRVRYFAAAPMAVAESDLILTAPRRLCELFARHFPLTVYAPPLPVPSFAVYAHWHERVDHEPAHRWLRELIAQVAVTGATSSVMAACP